MTTLISVIPVINGSYMLRTTITIDINATQLCEVGQKGYLGFIVFFILFMSYWNRRKRIPYYQVTDGVIGIIYHLY